MENIIPDIGLLGISIILLTIFVAINAIGVWWRKKHREKDDPSEDIYDD